MCNFFQKKEGIRIFSKKKQSNVSDVMTLKNHIAMKKKLYQNQAKLEEIAHHLLAKVYKF